MHCVIKFSYKIKRKLYYRYKYYISKLFVNLFYNDLMI